MKHELSKPNSLYLLGSKADEYNVQARTVAKYFLECVEWRLIATTSSLLAAASMWLARFVLRKEDLICHYQCAFCTVEMMFQLKKYAAKKIMKVQHSSHPCHVVLTEMDGLRLAHMYAHGPLSNGQKTHSQSGRRTPFTGLAWKMCRILNDWLIQVHVRAFFVL